jgi:hypothetical protein
MGRLIAALNNRAHLIGGIACPPHALDALLVFDH